MNRGSLCVNWLAITWGGGGEQSEGVHVWVAGMNNPTCACPDGQAACLNGAAGSEGMQRAESVLGLCKWDAGSEHLRAAAVPGGMASWQQAG